MNCDKNLEGEFCVSDVDSTRHGPRKEMLFVAKATMKSSLPRWVLYLCSEEEDVRVPKGSKLESECIWL